METINLESLQEYVSTAVDISIQDKNGEEKAPYIRKSLVKLETCPDDTHLRIFFDHKRFFAVPLTSKVTMNKDEWIAFDTFSELYYVIRKVD
ncbi:hypothetical protein SM124_07570 [Bacillus sp. 31A1R]|uniref:Uncharacterized protein n=1 Tax=Robertmurraya mangrovi TaxID=3098077 RepID=A0ABU5IWS6_9BACI|nr:hypothetical protein [Bacillus sp. 31A1R]MDZ5471605.1 hypothetical protein [Bacillus sp. 31A1R]